MAARPSGLFLLFFYIVGRVEILLIGETES